MTITTTTRKAGPFIGNGAQTVFPFVFKVFTTADVLVAEAVIATGVETQKTLTTHYAVALNADQDANPGGFVTMLVAPPTGDTLTIGSQVAQTQGVAATNGGGWYPEVLNGALDRATILIQQLAEKLTRALVFPISASGNSELPATGARAGKYLAFDAGGNPTTSVGTGSDATLRTDLAAAGGAALSGFSPAGTGAVATTVQAKLRECRSVLDKGADNTGATGASTKIQLALDGGAGDVYVPDGNYLIDADLVLPNSVNVYFSKGAVFKASANGRIFFKSTVSAYFTQVHNAQLDGNGKTGVVGFDMTNMRLNAGIFNPFFKLMDTGFIGRQGCFGLLISNPTAYGTTNPIVLINNNSGLVVDTPNFDNSVVSGGNAAGNGVHVQYGAGSNLGSIVRGGYIQGFSVGVDDRAIGTILDTVYFEACTTADISSSVTARNGRYRSIGHWGSTGAAGYLMRNTDAALVEYPTMGSGARTKLFDADATNTNCRAVVGNSNASYQTPLGTTAGILLSEIKVGFTVTDGSGAGLSLTQNSQAIWSTSGSIVTITADITYPATANASFAVLNLPVEGAAGIAINAAVGFTNYGAPLLINGAGASVGILLASTSGNLQNVNMSGKRLAFTFSYIAK
jgi:hypothetical protein